MCSICYVTAIVIIVIIVVTVIIAILTMIVIPRLPRVQGLGQTSGSREDGPRILGLLFLLLTIPPSNGIGFRV